jgi:pimeloyl-ACP methyl ester carboxylesterase
MTRHRGMLFALAISVLMFGLPVAPVHATSTAPLRWEACKHTSLKGVECSTLTVPLDWSDPQSGKTFLLPVARIPASGSSRERIGVLTYNPGGPGGPGIDYLRRIHADLPVEIQRRFDVVAWNPRGTNGVRPGLEECSAPDLNLPATGPIDWGAVADAYAADVAAANDACFTLNADVAPYLGTWQSVRDIDALRAGLGERQLNFWGMSYGTTMGRVYAQTFPNRVRTLLLDGAIDPQATTGSYAREQMWSHAMSMARLTQWFTPAVRAAHRRVMAALDERTLTTSWGAPVTRVDVDFAIAEFSGRQFNFEEARATVLLARDALFSPSERKRVKATDRLADLIGVPRPDAEPGSDLEDFVLSFVNCSDFPERISQDEVRTVTQQAARISGIASGIYALVEATMCVGLPNFGIPIEQRAAIRIPNPPIILNSVADPFTSLWAATLMANAFPGGRLITYDSTQHVTYTSTDSTCVNAPVTHYFLTQQRPRRDIACSLAPPFS